MCRLDFCSKEFFSDILFDFKLINATMHFVKKSYNLKISVGPYIYMYLYVHKKIPRKEQIIEPDHNGSIM